MQAFLVDVPIRKLSPVYASPDDYFNPIPRVDYYKDFVIKETHFGITYQSVLHNYYAKNLSFLTFGYMVIDILHNKITHPISVYINTDGKLECHPGVSRVRALNFLGIETVKGIMFNNVPDYVKIIDEVEIPNSQVIEKSQHFEYLPTDHYLDSNNYHKCAYTDSLIFSKHKLFLARFYANLNSINITTSNDIKIKSFYTPGKKELLNNFWNIRHDFNTKSLVEIKINNNTSDLDIIVKENVQYNILELLLFIVEDYKTYKTEDDKIIMINNNSNSDNVLILPKHYSDSNYLGAKRLRRTPTND